jgi:hypothetical protein
MGMSDYDRAHVGDLVGGEGTWFTAKLFRLLADADADHRDMLALGFPEEVEAFEAWQRGDETRAVPGEGPAPLNPSAIDEITRDWYFTFGFGHAHPMGYSVIHGTFYTARAEMVRRWGQKWSMQYDSAEAAGVQRFGLHEVDGVHHGA